MISLPIVLLAVLGILAIAVMAYLQTAQFGGRLSKSHIQRYAQSTHWKEGKFVNLEETSMSIPAARIPGLVKEQLSKNTGREPAQPLPVQPMDAAEFTNTTHSFVWYGHSVLLLRINNLNLLIDPMFGQDASPIAPLGGQRFSENTLEIIDTLPDIDAILITHDHYDHLDLSSIRKLRNLTDTWLVSLGVARHLERWGIEETKIREFDWWDEINFRGVQIVFTPSRHFSGRGISDRSRCLWGGWVFESETQRIYFSGDGGYGSHFEKIRERFGSFDLAFLECGQYNELWHRIHMYPEEAVQAGLDVNARIGVPVHWGAFSLALHPWKEPAERFVRAAADAGFKVLTPRPGEIIPLNRSMSTFHWWEEYS